MTEHIKATPVRRARAAAPLRAAEAAEYLLRAAHEHGSFISNLKLQKMLYYAQGWHLALRGGPLFPERFEAWVHGPVVRSVYQQYKGFGWRSIDTDVSNPAVDEATAAVLDGVVQRYLPLDAYALELMTHREPPWLAARGDLPIDAWSDEEIDLEMMRDFFTDLAAEEAAAAR